MEGNRPTYPVNIARQVINDIRCGALNPDEKRVYDPKTLSQAQINAAVEKRRALAGQCFDADIVRLNALPMDAPNLFDEDDDGDERMEYVDVQSDDDDDDADNFAGGFGGEPMDAEAPGAGPIPKPQPKPAPGRGAPRSQAGASAGAPKRRLGYVFRSMGAPGGFGGGSLMARKQMEMEALRVTKGLAAKAEAEAQAAEARRKHDQEVQQREADAARAEAEARIAEAAARIKHAEELRQREAKRAEELHQLQMQQAAATFQQAANVARLEVETRMARAEAERQEAEARLLRAKADAVQAGIAADAKRKADEAAAAHASKRILRDETERTLRVKGELAQKKERRAQEVRVWLEKAAYDRPQRERNVSYTPPGKELQAAQRALIQHYRDTLHFLPLKKGVAVDANTTDVRDLVDALNRDACLPRDATDAPVRISTQPPPSALGRRPNNFNPFVPSQARFQPMDSQHPNFADVDWRLENFEANRYVPLAEKEAPDSRVVLWRPPPHIVTEAQLQAELNRIARGEAGEDYWFNGFPFRLQSLKLPKDVEEHRSPYDKQAMALMNRFSISRVHLARDAASSKTMETDDEWRFAYAFALLVDTLGCGGDTFQDPYQTHFTSP